MINKSHSRIGVIGSLVAHSLIFTGIWAAFHYAKPTTYEEVTSISLELIASRLEQQQVAISSDADFNAENAVSENIADATTEKQTPEQEVEHLPEPEVKAEPIVANEPLPSLQKPKIKPQEKPKPKERVKEKPKDQPKPKEKPKEKPKTESPKTEKKIEKAKTEPKKAVKALEKGNESRQGIVAKAVPNAHQGNRNQAGIPNGATNGNNPSINQAGSVNGTTTRAGQNDNASNAYRATLLRALQQRANSSYPQREKMMRKTGVVVLKFTLSPNGQISNVQVQKSSGNDNLDAAAVKAAQSTKPPAPPAGFPSTINVPVKFEIR